MSIAASPYAPSTRNKPTSRKLSERSPDNPEHTKAKTVARTSADEEGQRLVFNSPAGEDEFNEDEAAPPPPSRDQHITPLGCSKCRYAAKGCGTYPKPGCRVMRQCDIEGKPYPWTVAGRGGRGGRTPAPAGRGRGRGRGRSPATRSSSRVRK